MNLPEKRVEEIIYAFFGRHGLKHYIVRKTAIRIKNLGSFYFHKATLKKVERSKEEKREILRRQARNRYHDNKRKLNLFSKQNSN